MIGGAAPPVVRANELTMAKPDCRMKDWGDGDCYDVGRQLCRRLDCLPDIHSGLIVSILS